MRDRGLIMLSVSQKVAPCMLLGDINVAIEANAYCGAVVRDFQ